LQSAACAVDDFIMTGEFAILQPMQEGLLGMQHGEAAKHSLSKQKLESARD